MKKATKKPKTKRHLDFYKRCIETGVMASSTGMTSYEGLCKAANFGELSRKTFNKLIVPTYDERDALEREGKDWSYWASGSKKPKYSKFTPLRQTIVLFMAAIKGEL